jgi:hypothetical protein
MHGVQFLCAHFYHVFDAYARLYMSLRLRFGAANKKGTPFQCMGKLYADAIDTYHMLWVLATFVCYAIGWRLTQADGETHWVYWIILLVLCTYRIFEMMAALVEMYFRESNARHHQFRIMLHAGLHFLATGFAFAFFFLASDRAFESFTMENDDGKMESQFYAFFDPIHYSLLTVLYMGGNEEPQNWIGKLLGLVELAIGFVLVTFIFLNITQVWYRERKRK